jgi:hypothetical protein
MQWLELELVQHNCLFQHKRTYAQNLLPHDGSRACKTISYFLVGAACPRPLGAAGRWVEGGGGGFWAAPPPAPQYDGWGELYTWELSWLSGDSKGLIYFLEHKLSYCLRGGGGWGGDGVGGVSPIPMR